MDCCLIAVNSISKTNSQVTRNGSDNPTWSEPLLLLWPYVSPFFLVRTPSAVLVSPKILYNTPSTLPSISYCVCIYYSSTRNRFPLCHPLSSPLHFQQFCVVPPFTAINSLLKGHLLRENVNSHDMQKNIPLLHILSFIIVFLLFTKAT